MVPSSRPSYSSSGRISVTMISRLYLNLQDHANGRVVACDKHSTFGRNQGINVSEMGSLTMWVARAADGLDDHMISGTNHAATIQRGTDSSIGSLGYTMPEDEIQALAGSSCSPC